MYLKYTDATTKHMGIWKVSPDLTTQNAVYFSESKQNIKHNNTVRAIEDFISFCHENKETIDVLTDEEYFQERFLDRI